MIAVAFKEWGAICAALASGEQTLVLRKGGIAETGGVFTPEQPRFWLWPTAFHADPATLKPGAATSPTITPHQPGANIPLTHWAEVQQVHWLSTLEQALACDDLHAWSEATIRQRFAYRSPGLYLLLLRIHARSTPHDVVDRPEYAGCKSWVPLHEPLSTDHSHPVLDDTAFAQVQAELARRIAS